MEALILSLRFRQIGIQSITTHCGFIPDACGSAAYRETLVAIYEIAAYCAADVKATHNIFRTIAPFFPTFQSEVADENE